MIKTLEGRNGTIPPAVESRRAPLLPDAFGGSSVRRTELTIGVLPGEGIGPEVTGGALTVLKGVELVCPELKIDVRCGGVIGNSSIQECGDALSRPVIDFCRDLFAAGGALLTGPGSGRFVYDMRREFDLYFKLNPLVPAPELRGAGRMKSEATAGVEIVIVRDNAGGVYQGDWDEMSGASGTRVATHRFRYTQEQVQRTLSVAAEMARRRRGELTLVVKPSGVPTVSRLWSDCARAVAHREGVRLRELEIDFAVFQLIQSPREFDVIVTPNLFGDLLSDVGGVLLGSRGLCYGANYSTGGAAVYQTNHGAAFDLAGTDRANPVAQIQALSMMLRESFGLAREADLVEAAVADVWRSGVRTIDIQEAGCQVVGTCEMAEQIARAVVRLGDSRADRQ
jgi:3-isopropylmalate dehydrogenase